MTFHEFKRELEPDERPAPASDYAVHFARPTGGFTTPERPFTCVVCGEAVEKRTNRVWRHVRRTR